jgi:C_GCAxxG_C_C family probable redox protein
MENMEAESSRKAILSKLDKKVREYITISSHCAQTAFLVLQEQFGLDGGQILKALTPFVGGVALRGETCGAVIGCLMAIGLVYGRERLGDWEGYFDSLPPARRFCSRFEKEVGGTICREIIKSDLRKLFDETAPIETKKRRQITANQHRCAVVGKGVRIAAEIISEKTSHS